MARVNCFWPIVEALQPHVSCEVIRYPDDVRGYDRHERFVRERLPRDREHVVVGESFSGPIAISLAASPPSGMVGYVLCASFVRCPRTMLRVCQPLLPLFSLTNVPSIVATYFLMGRFGSAALRRAHAGVLRSVSPAALAARLRAIARVDVRSELTRAKAPGIYLRATEDRLVPRSAARLFAQIAPMAQVAEIVGPHFLLQTQPVECARVLRQFITKIRE